MLAPPRRSVTGVTPSLPLSSVQTARVPLSSPYSSRNSAGITTWPLELTTVRKLLMGNILPLSKTIANRLTELVGHRPSTIDHPPLCSYNHSRVIKTCVQALSAQFAEGHWRTS